MTRPRLLEKLHAGRAGKVTLVAAPAGFGKTTLVAEWLRALDVGTAIAWLSLQQADNDPTQFWAYVMGAVYGPWSQSKRERPAKAESAIW
ncbi:MAG: hypothetical protein R2911_23215 [Caldilineaceae bacterium]